MTKFVMTRRGRIRVGIGGWTYEPWRETFYPPDLPRKRELEYASRQVTAIEINATYYRTQKPESFAKWRDATPDDFVFSLKAPRYATNRTVLAEAGASIGRFMASGIERLGDKLGPILWQFAATKRFEADDFERFLDLLQGHAAHLRHVLEVRHESFIHADFVALARRYQVAVVYTDSDSYPSFAATTSNFIYARLMRSDAALATGYPEESLAAWAERARTWARGDEPEDLPFVGTAPVQAEPRQAEPRQAEPRDVFIFMINGAKQQAPAAARHLLAGIGQTPPGGKQ